jgi:hypothetical protein
LSDSGNFPSDLYIASGLLESLDRGYALKVVAPEEVEAAIDETIAVLMLTEVDYRTGRLHDMRALTRRAHAAGALTVWDLAHSAGAIPVELEAAEPISPSAAPTNISMPVLARRPSSMSRLTTPIRRGRRFPAGWVMTRPLPLTSTIGPGRALSECGSVRPRSLRWPRSTPPSTSGTASA